MGNKTIQFSISLYAFAMTFILWWALICSIPADGIIIFDFNRVGEIWLDFWLFTIPGIFCLLYGFKEFFKN